jgi:GT2 family glycosyltransferase
LGSHRIAGHLHYGLLPGDPGYFGRADLLQDFSAVTAACLVIRKSIYDEVGGLDENLTMAYSDVDFCIRVQNLGYRNLFTPNARLIHHESASRGYEDSLEKLERFEQEVKMMKDRWGELLLNDPAHNPNLSLETGTPTPAFPPRVQKPWKE